MTFTVLLFAHRKRGLAPAQFKDHLENTHIPLLEKTFGPLFPISHTRRYVDRSNEDPYDATVLVGTQEHFDYDVVSELVFSDKAVFEAFFTKYKDPEVAPLIQEDEAKFLDASKMSAVVLGETCTTTQ
ncbi:hypothetical protein FSARC_11115 [Fusarium sarcochroum]|uniref:EthD domain-containing protein n=1 Tax=Fusarium sarcochroum TaxID=1208366 RepID=A0A8H4THW7_9HYPO|nr:hypothetical protein FSARC_11115 [Fusarium sarcochroum]